MKYYIKTFGCQQNKADSERIKSAFQARGMKPARGYKDADYVVINTCMVRQSAEDRVYGLVRNLGKLKMENGRLKIIVTGCMVGLAFRDKTGRYLQRIRERMPEVDEFMPIEEVGFDNQPVRQDHENAWVPISNGCNNFCTFCVVPFTRGREISRPYEDIISECLHLKLKGYKNITLLGQNVNSYGADLIIGEKNIQVMRDLDKVYFQASDRTSAVEEERSDGKTAEVKWTGKKITPVFVKHLGRYRIPTLFPYLLESVAKIGFEKVDFISSNPWDFSDELIDVIASKKNITRLIHLPIQSGDNNVLKRMNRWYKTEEYLRIINKLRKKVPEIKFSTDIIVGFCGETDEEFQNTVRLVKLVGYEKAYISMYSQRPMTAATKVFKDDVSHAVKKQRWQILENLINKPILKITFKSTGTILHAPAS
ncbi:radical SAM protein [Candidatus Roizmanbacteria bacterium]|nr:radical SAM protein [Candidatus Roizmanbacteria bacterium]